MQILCRMILISVVSLGLFRNEIKAPSQSGENIVARCVKTDRFLKANVPKKEIKVRITTYWAKGGDTDEWSAKRQSSTGVRLKPNVSVAVDPRIIPYFRDFIFLILDLDTLTILARQLSKRKPARANILLLIFSFCIKKMQLGLQTLIQRL